MAQDKYYVMSAPTFSRRAVIQDGWGPLSYQKTAIQIARNRANEGKTSWVVKLVGKNSLTIIAKVEP